MSAELPARRTDDDTFDVVDDALSTLAERKGCGWATTWSWCTCSTP